MEVIPIVIACLGGATGLGGLLISIRADRRAERADKRAAGAEERAARAEADGVRAKERELWTELISAMQEIVGANVLQQDLRPVLVRVRSCMAELVDGVTDECYQRLDRWMTVEHQVINGLLEQTTLQLPGPVHTIQQIENAHRPPNEWAAAFVNNLRVARKLEPGPYVAQSIDEMIEAGEKALSQLPAHTRSRPRTSRTRASKLS